MANKPFLPDTAMVFAAGFGKRMLPITKTIPKSMVEVGGKPLIDYTLDNLAESGVRRAVVNTHHLAELIEEYVQQRQAPKVAISHEEVILETGGGIVKALLLLGSKPFFSLNSDVIIINGKKPALQRMAAMWEPDIMDVLMLLHPVDKAVGYDGVGDFNLAEDGHIIRPDDGKCKYVFTGAMIIKPEIFKGLEEKPFSVYSDFIHIKYRHKDGTLSRVFGLEHDGDWLHIGTPEGIEDAEKVLGC